MKKVFALIFVAATLTVASCGGSKTETSATDTTAATADTTATVVADTTAATADTTAADTTAKK